MMPMNDKPRVRDRTGMKIAALAFFAGGSVAALFWRGCGPKEEPIQRTECTECAPAPLKGDLVCVPEQGEADPLSPNFDPESCGYCGDGVRQVRINGAHGSAVRVDEFGIRTQDVTRRPTEISSRDIRARQSHVGETYIICDADFHCGNGIVDQNAPYPAWIPGPEGSPFSVGIKIVTETPDSCFLDQPEEVRRVRQRPRVPEPDSPLPVQDRLGFHCPSQVASTDSTEIVSSQSASTRGVLRRINDAIIGRAPNLRRALGVSDTATLHVDISMLVDPSGRLSLSGVSARSGGALMGDQTAIINATGLSLGGLSLVAPGTECNWTITIRVPPTLPQ